MSGRRWDAVRASRFLKRIGTETRWKTGWEHGKAQERRCDIGITTIATPETWRRIHRLENVRENREMSNPRFERQRALDRGMVMGMYCLKVTLEQPASCCIQVVHAVAALVVEAPAVYGNPQELAEKVCMNPHRGVRMHRVAQTEPGLGVIQGS